MPSDLTNTLVVGISTTALFDMSGPDRLFREYMTSDPATAAARYRAYMLEHEQEPLADGTGMPLVKALLALNGCGPREDPRPLVEVVIMSRNTAETGLRILSAIRTRGLAIGRHVFTGGGPVVRYIAPFGVDLFLTTHPGDAQEVIDQRACAAAILKQPPKDGHLHPDDQVRIAFDGDAVLFDDSSEVTYRTRGLAHFHADENERQDEPLADGPYANFLRKLSLLQDRLEQAGDPSPIRTAIVTARGAPAEMRVIKTLRHWGVKVDEMLFLGGIAKAEVVKAFGAHIFFDDQDIHLDPTARHVPSGRVPYSSGSPLAGG